MRNHCLRILKERFHSSLIQSRDRLGITQEEMAGKLMMAGRTYIELDHGKSCCSAVTLSLFLIYVCDDPMEFLDDLRSALEKDLNAVEYVH